MDNSELKVKKHHELIRWRIQSDTSHI